MTSEIRIIYPPDTEEEVELKRKVQEIKVRYQEQLDAEIKPLIDRLYEIAHTKTPKYILVDKPDTDNGPKGT